MKNSRVWFNSASGLVLFAALLSHSLAAADGPMSASDAYALPQSDPDATISYGDQPRQFGELRLPDGDGPFPVALLMHGGCWLEDYDHGYMDGLADAIVDLDMAVWTVGFRRIGAEGGGWPNTFLDAADGADHLRELAETWPLDPGRVIAVGHSAGGHLALWLATRPQLPEDSPLYRPDPLPIAGVLALAAAADLEGLSEAKTCANAATRLLDGMLADVPERYRDGSPMQRIPSDVPQILINGSLDTTWTEPADRYYDAARAAGAPIQRRVMVGAGHFELVAPQAEGWDLVREALNELKASLR